MPKVRHAALFRPHPPQAWYGRGVRRPLAGTRAQSVQRLQIGIGGVVLMVLLVGLASLIQDRTREVDAASVPGAAP